MPASLLNSEGRVRRVLTYLGMAASLSLPIWANGFPDECDPDVIDLVPSEEVFVVADTPRDLVAGDLDLDGHVDAVVGSWGEGGSSVITIFRNNGSGSILKVQEIQTQDLHSLALGHLDENNLLDLATANGTSIRVYSNAGDGMFAEPVNLTPTGESRFVTIGDADSNGAQDILSTDHSGDSLSLFFNRGGSFDPAESLTVGDQPRGIVVADFNGDESQDLAVTLREAGSERVAVFLGEGEGHFADAVPHAVLDAHPTTIAATDLYHDGAPDLVVRTFDPNPRQRATSTLVVRCGAGHGAPQP